MSLLGAIAITALSLVFAALIVPLIAAVVGLHDWIVRRRRRP